MQGSCPSYSTALFALAQTALFALSLLMISSVGASAQIDRAELEGTVNDASGAVIRGARVQVLAADTGISQEQQTNSNGYYRVAAGKDHDARSENAPAFPVHGGSRSI